MLLINTLTLNLTMDNDHKHKRDNLIKVKYWTISAWVLSIPGNGPILGTCREDRLTAELQKVLSYSFNVKQDAVADGRLRP